MALAVLFSPREQCLAVGLFGNPRFLIESPWAAVPAPLGVGREEEEGRARNGWAHEPLSLALAVG